MPEIGNNIIKANVDLVDETFDVSQSENYSLSIQIEQDRFAFCVFNTVIKKYIVLRSYPLPSNIDLYSIDAKNSPVSPHRAIFENDDLLTLKYKNRGNVWVSSRCTLMPEHLFDNTQAGSYMAFNHGTVADEQVLQNHIRAAALYNVFSYPKKLTELLNFYQPNIGLFHHATPFIRTNIADLASWGRTAMAVYCYSGYTDILAVKNGKLQYYNTFQTNTVDDALYFLTLVSNMLKVDMLSTKLVYFGNNRQNTAILEKYVHRVVECEPVNSVTYSHYISESFRKDFINLFNLYGCE